MTSEGRTIVVLGTRRGVGKTTIICGILERVRSLGHRAVGVVPIETGCTYGDNHDLIGRDGARLRLSSSGPVPPLVVSPYRFAADATPADAASQSGLELELADLVSAVDAASEFGTLIVVEGPHTGLSPLVTDGLTVDLAQKLRAPALIVCEGDAGPLEEACKARGIPVAAVLDVTTFEAEDLAEHLEQNKIAETLIECLRPA